MYGALILSFIVLMTALSCGKKKPDHKIERRKKLSKRTRISVLIVLALVPATLIAGWMIFGGRQYYAFALLLVLECSVPFVMVFEGRKPEPRELVLIAVASAIAIAERAAFFAMPGFTPVMGLVILAGAAFGGESGFIAGAVTMLLSNFYFRTGALDTVADVFHGTDRFPGRNHTKKKPPFHVGFRCGVRGIDIRRNHESRFCTYVGQDGKHSVFDRILCCRASYRSGTCFGHIYHTVVLYRTVS